MTKHIELAAQTISKAGFISEVEPEELAEIMQHTEINPKDAAKLAGTIVYIRKRFIEGLSRPKAFKKAFPQRCIPNRDAKVPFPNTKDEISVTAMDIKAKRLEQSAIYKKVVGLLQTNLYISYALDRMHVLDIALKKIKDENVHDRDKVNYMKLFMESTNKPEESKGFELNVDIHADGTSLRSVEESLASIASKLDGKDASSIIDVLAIEENK